MLATRMINIHQIFLYNTFRRMLLYDQNGRVSIVIMEEILLFKVVDLIQLKKMLIKGPIPHRTLLFHILFGWHFASEE